MNEERTGKCLRQVEHTRGHLWHRYSIIRSQIYSFGEFNWKSIWTWCILLWFTTTVDTGAKRKTGQKDKQWSTNHYTGNWILSNTDLSKNCSRVFFMSFMRQKWCIGYYYKKNTPLTAVDTDLYWFIMFNLSKMNAYSFHILLVDLFKVECVLCKYIVLRNL